MCHALIHIKDAVGQGLAFPSHLKATVDHRVVIRNAKDRIVSDEHFESFAVAEVVYRQAVASTSRNLEVTLQHGARVVFRANGQS